MRGLPQRAAFAWVLLGPGCLYEQDPSFSPTADSATSGGSTASTSAGTSGGSSESSASGDSAAATSGGSGSDSNSSASTTDSTSMGPGSTTDPQTTTDTGDTTGSASEHRVFVSSTQFQGSFGGIAFADSECQSRADEAGLGGSWRAMVSEPGVSARSRLQISGPVRTLEGGQVAADAGDLWDGTIGVPVTTDQNGTQVSGKTWTGTLPDGNVDPQTCNTWSETAGFGQKGDIGAMDASWIREGNLVCMGQGHFYCLSQ